MGIGTSMKETTLHFYRDPLVEMVSTDEDVNLRGILVYGSADKDRDKYLAAERVGVTLECARADGAIFSCNGLGNNHVDFAHAIEAAESRGIPSVALSMCPSNDFVVQNKYLQEDVVCYYKSYEKTKAWGDETNVLAENTQEQMDARKALARLKLKMRKVESKG